MAYTSADLDTIEKAIRTGAETVRFADGKQVTYRTLAELRAIKAEIEAELDPSSVAAARPIVVLAVHARD